MWFIWGGRSGLEIYAHNDTLTDFFFLEKFFFFGIFCATCLELDAYVQHLLKYFEILG